MPRSRLLLSAITLAMALPMTALSAQQSLTIYSDGRVLMRQAFDTKVPAGTSHAEIPIGAADPSSVFALDPGVTISHATFEGALSEQDVLPVSYTHLTLPT